MIVLKIRGEKRSKWCIAIPTIAVDWSGSNSVEIWFAWLNGEICISISK